MKYVLEKEELDKALYSTYCPKCGLIIARPEDPCPWCDYSAETELTPSEAREFTYAGD